MTTIAPIETAKIIFESANSRNVKLTICANGVVTAHKTFTPGDTSEYCKAETDVSIVLSKVPRSNPGSVWGTDSGSVGGAIGCKNGLMELNKSGCNKNVLRELAKLR